MESHKDWFNEENYERKYVNVTQERESEEKSNINVNESSAPANTVAKDQDHVLPPAKSPNVEVMAS